MTNQYITEGSHFFADGSIVEHETGNLFRLLSGTCRFNCSGGKPGAYDEWYHMLPVVELRQGDYTDSGTADHAKVVQAFVNAGATSRERHFSGNHFRYVGWSFSGIDHEDFCSAYIGRYLDPLQVINATNAQGNDSMIKPGIYVNIRELIFDEYVKVHEAFTNAEYQGDRCSEAFHEDFRYIGINSDGVIEHWGRAERYGADRQEVSASDLIASEHPSFEVDQLHVNVNLELEGDLTMSTKSDDPLKIKRLLDARKARDDAQANYETALQEVREALGDGFKIEEKQSTTSSSDSDPDDWETWQPGDTVMATEDSLDITEGRYYRLFQDSVGLISFFDDVEDESDLKDHHKIMQLVK